MNITIAGGTGFIGSFMTERYLKEGHHVSIISRSLSKVQKKFGDRVTALEWKSLNAKNLETADLIINLTGAGIADKRWSNSRKRELLESRVKPTETLAGFCAELNKASPPLFNASAVGIYGLQKPLIHSLPAALDEAQPIHESADFASYVVREWEKSAKAPKEKGIRVLHLRFGVVLGKNGGMLARLKPSFRLGFGGKIGNGQQPLSWVSLVDLCRAVDFLFQQAEIAGPVNVVSPECITQAEFAKAMGKVLHRPAFMKMPAFVVKLLFGQMGEELLLNGQHAVPQVLLEHGFTFKYPDIESALTDALK